MSESDLLQPVGVDPAATLLVLDFRSTTLQRDQDHDIASGQLVDVRRAAPVPETVHVHHDQVAGFHGSEGKSAEEERPSSTPRGNASPRSPDDASPAPTAEGPACGWCRSRLEDARSRYCGRKCRQAAFRLRRRRTTEAANERPGTFAYADPPYPGLAAKYYKGEATYGGEVDHRELVQSLEASGYTGWALSTSQAALRDVLPLCPAEARVCAWVKPIGASTRTFGLHNVWEPLIVVRGRQVRPGKPDWLRAQPARGGGDLPGRKPIAFCAWLFDCLGMLPGDQLVDLFPGTGVVSRAWASLAPARTTLAVGVDDVSPRYQNDASLPPGGDASSKYSRDVSAGAGGDSLSSRAALDGGLR